ncbi:type II and III secretion system protein family protein [Chitinasiproducens palmae]|uniref:Pilus assembly protein CpaC n=1 Tax=Chitinasiproducens palmae TaxID=1770053 RepID=A0A1H2PV91_9BURK|nr:type II and III secretion system protein family protein [Chitinasiproducens palmae]SDV51163.1 pilus assembly protein CpaC [Chitinasiproducens palmae]
MRHTLGVYALCQVARHVLSCLPPRVAKAAWLWRGIVLCGATAGALPAVAQVPPLPPALLDRGSLARSLALSVDEQRMVPAPDLERVAIGDPDVADVVPVRGGLLVIAKKPGTTTLSVWRNGQRETRQTVRVRSALADALLPASGPRLEVYGDTALLSGQAGSSLDHEAAVAVAARSAARVVDRSVVTPSGVVQVDVKVVEFSRRVLKEAGFNLFTSRANGFGFGVFNPNGVASYAAGTGLSFGDTVGTGMSSAFNLVAGPFGNGLFGNLSLLESNGMARVLAEPSLVALSGQSASFLAGGELPIPEAGGLGTTTITYKSFGVGLTVTPTVLGPTRIALKVAPEASDLDFNRALVLNGVAVPAITTRRADTTVELGDGESFVIGGLVSRTTTSSLDKVPLLGDLPIIGTFFKRLSYQQDDKELVIVVTPHLVRPIARGVALALPGQARDAADQPVWGSYLGGATADNELPGFSR